jgi:hypothetical protein
MGPCPVRLGSDARSHLRFDSSGVAYWTSQNHDDIYYRSDKLKILPGGHPMVKVLVHGIGT